MKKEITQQAILSAAKELFVANGYKGTTTVQIAKKAGISEMTLFRHFSTKEDIFLTVIHPVVSFLNHFEISDQSDVRKIIQDVLENRLQFLIEEKELIRLVVMESFLNDRSINPVFDVVKKMNHLFTSLPETDRELLVRLIAGYILAHIFLPETQSDDKAIQEHFLETVIYPLADRLSVKQGV